MQEQELQETAKKFRFDVFCPSVAGCGKYLLTVNDNLRHGVACPCGCLFVQCGAFSHSLGAWLEFHDVSYSDGIEIEKLIREEKVIELVFQKDLQKK